MKEPTKSDGAAPRRHRKKKVRPGMDSANARNVMGHGNVTPSADGAMGKNQRTGDGTENG